MRIALAQLPPVDAVLISHDHYDHLDTVTIVATRSWKNVFIVPLGIGAPLAQRVRAKALIPVHAAPTCPC